MSEEQPKKKVNPIKIKSIMDNSLNWEENKEEDFSYKGMKLLENTYNNIRKLDNVEISGKELGRSLTGHFSEKKINLFLNSIKKGYKIGNSVDLYEDKEMEKIGNLFEDV